jgi:hypothetical protein
MTTERTEGYGKLKRSLNLGKRGNAEKMGFNSLIKRFLPFSDLH